MSLGDFLTNIRAMVLCLGEPPGGFCNAGCCCCCCFSSLEVFYVFGLLFLATGTPPWLLRPMKGSTSSELYLGYFRLLYFCQVFSSHFYRECYMSPGQCCYSFGLYKPLIIVSVQGYLMLVDCVYLLLLILKQYLLPVYCFTIKQAGIIVIKHKAPSNRQVL